MKFLRVLSIDLRRVFSWRLVFAVAITFVIYSFAGIGFIGEDIDVWYIIEMAIWGSTAFFTIYTIPAFAFAPSLATDWKSNATRYWIIRIGSDRYILSKMLVCAVSGFLTHFVAAIMLMFTISFKFPLFIRSSTTEIYETILMENGHALTGIILFIADRSLKALIAAEVGMTVSVFFIHPYVAVASPLVVLLTMSRLIYKYKLPSVLDIASWDTMIPADTVGEMILYKMILTMFLVGILCLISVQGMRKRLAHE